MSEPSRPQTQAEWKEALEALPDRPSNIPAFFFGHGSPTLLVEPSGLASDLVGLSEMTGPSSRLAKFLSDFGPALLRKYSPSAIIVFSAHWETNDQILVSDYGENQPLLMDYYGFDDGLYQVIFRSNGATEISERIIGILRKSGIIARKFLRSEPRGVDGRGFSGPGLDHGVFVPFKFMFGDDFTSVPIIQVSICGSLDPDENFRLGRAVAELRSERILILSGGLTIHNLRDLKTFGEETAGPELRGFQDAIYKAAEQVDPVVRRIQLFELTNHPGFKRAHPRADHFIPLYVAAGAGESGKVMVLNAQYAAPTIAFGL